MIVKKFEQYLKSIKFSQKIFIYLLPLVAVFVGVFISVVPLQEEKLQLSYEVERKLLANIKRKSPKIIKNDVKKVKKELLSLKQSAEEDLDSLYFLRAKLTNLEVLEFNELQWTATLDEILKKSLSLDIKIKHIKNSDSNILKSSENLVPKKYVEIIGTGRYMDALKYLHFIENRQFLVDIKNIKMDKKLDTNEIDFHINFTIYGVNI